MNIVVVYGSPCSGKTKYVQNYIGENDIAFDYDKMLAALTFNEKRHIDKHFAHDIVMLARKSIIEATKTMSQGGDAYIVTAWPSDYLKKSLAGLDVSYKQIEATRADCIKNLECDASRPDKEGWTSIVNAWHDKHGDKPKGASNMKELRICEIRAVSSAGGQALRLEGMPIVYNQPALINDPKGQYVEIIRPGALDNTDITDTRLLYNHDTNRVPLARTPKTMQLTKSPAGLHMTATLPDTPEAKSVYTAVLRGDLSGMSFAFSVPDGGDKFDPDTNTREIFVISKLYEVSIVPFPAYPQTSIEARAAMENSANLALLRREAIIKANIVLMKEV